MSNDQSLNKSEVNTGNIGTSSVNKQYDFFDFYFLTDIEFDNMLKIINTGEERNICTCGYILKYDYRNNTGELGYDNKTISVNFQRVESMVELSKNPTKDKIYFIYGLLHKNPQSQKGELICSVWRLMDGVKEETINSYIYCIRQRRKIIEDCNSMKEDKMFWYK